jgi:hypothetical protein
MSAINERLTMIFGMIELFALELSGLKLIRAVVKESGYGTPVVVRAIEHGKRPMSKYGITQENVDDSTTIDSQHISKK